MAEAGLHHEPFRFQHLKDERVFLFHEDRHVMTLAGKAARRFLDRAEGLAGEPLQLLMAKATKNFKRGNERPAK
jgi:hypothetical protein